MRPTPAVEAYSEQPRTYRSTVVIALGVVAGFVLDLVLGGAGVHLFAWLGALVLIAGLDALAVRAAKKLRTVTVTSDRLLVGEHSFDRAEIVGVDVPAARDVAPIAPTPRGSTVVGVRIAGGGVLGVPSRRPEQLAGALGYRATPVLLDVRPAEPADLQGLPELERRADTVFSVAGIGPLPPAATVERFAASPGLLVAGRPPVGFARIDVVDDGAHLESISVLPGHMRRGVGTELLEAACAWAAAEGHGHITLCTFADVVWNGPFYARHGFVVVPEVQWTPGLAELRAQEAQAGLDALGPRVVMRRELPPADGGAQLPPGR